MVYPSMFPTGQTAVDPLEAAMATVRSFCGWHVAPVIEQDLILDGSGSLSLLLPSKHVLGVSGVTENGTPVQVHWSASGILRKESGQPWAPSLRGVTLHLRHGYEPEEVGDVLAVAKAVEARIRMNPGGNVTSYQAGTQGQNMRAGSVPLFADERRTLQPYQLSWGV